MRLTTLNLVVFFSLDYKYTKNHISSYIVMVQLKKWNIMKVVIEIEDDKKEFILNILTQHSCVKISPLKSEKLDIMSGILESVDELNQVKQGKLKTLSVEELLNEL